MEYNLVITQKFLKKESGWSVTPAIAQLNMPPIKRKTWDHAAMIQAVNAVRRKEIGYLRAAKQFGVPKGTLERYVKRMSAQKILSRFVWEDGQPCLLI
ncbi:hypothetical protein HHI36_024357 [Cryptolaemus montrouzieri]|uniref:HTH psq-type domain-containing protein n=1 Tax=Cryptolaemus montrouzieri TaxID=559131 RepID=A0ABD2NYR3_9CUCU